MEGPGTLTTWADLRLSLGGHGSIPWTIYREELSLTEDFYVAFLEWRYPIRSVSDQQHMMRLVSFLLGCEMGLEVTHPGVLHFEHLSNLLGVLGEL